MKIKISGINISEKKGTVKTPVNEVKINKLGIVGDAHAGNWHRQVSLLGRESIDNFITKANRKIEPGEFAENIILEGIDFTKIAVLDRFKINDVILEVTQIGKACHGDGCPIYVAVGDCVMPREGVFARVVSEGDIKTGDTGEYISRPLKIRIITLSDRASKGEYEDLSGPRIKKILNEHFQDKRWHTEIDSAMIPDEDAKLLEVLQKAKSEQVDFVFTTGGTGIGPRDITPEVVSAFCDKMIPGIMDHIRLKYGASIPNALISRSVAGVAGETIIYSLPGSVKAVDEYMQEILKTMEHLLLMLHGIGH